MAHEYSKFKNKNIPYAKVGRRVFNSLFDAETFCTEHGLDVNSAIEYRDDPELKNNIQTIAKYQKAILQECLDRLKARGTEAYYFPTSETFDGMEKFLLKKCIDGDLLITMGAGNILEVGEHLLGQ